MWQKGRVRSPAFLFLHGGNVTSPSDRSNPLGARTIAGEIAELFDSDQ